MNGYAVRWVCTSLMARLCTRQFFCPAALPKKRAFSFGLLCLALVFVFFMLLSGRFSVNSNVLGIKWYYSQYYHTSPFSVINIPVFSGLRSALQTPAVQGRFSVVYWYWKQPAAAGTFFEKHSRKLHSFFLFLLYDILVKKSIIEEGVCIMAKILIVDDEPRIRELIREHLQYSGYICEEAADGTAALTQLSGGAFDLVILDLMMPFMDGMTCLREMRARHINTPVIILTARGEEYDKLAGLESGADDYVVKPFSPRELVARVKAVLNRTMPKPAAASDTMTFGELTIDTASHTVRVSGEEVALTPKEFDLLVFLASNKGIALSREKILQKVWNYDYFGEDRTVDTHVKMLRGHLGKCRSYIATVWGIGYKFDPDATR